MKPPIVVLGSGRSGTSNCTMLLHTRLGVDMGNPQWVANNWREPNWRTTRGNWERASTRIALYAVMNCKQLTPYLLVEVLHEIGELMGDRPWGFKHPNFTMFLPMMLEFFPDARYIHCKRQAKHVAKSMKKIYHKQNVPEADYFRKALLFQKKCDSLLATAKHAHTVWVEDYKSVGEDEVLKRLSEFVGLPILPEPLPVPGPFVGYGPCGGLHANMTKENGETDGYQQSP